MDVLLGQMGRRTPDTLLNTLNEIFYSLLVCLLIGPQACIAFLAQNMELLPLLQLPQNRKCSQIRCLQSQKRAHFRQQGSHVPKQADLLFAFTVSTNSLDPYLGDWHHSALVRQTDYQ
jgi:hypothetical protein